MTEGPEASYLAQYIYKFFKNKKLKNIIIKSGRYKHHGPPKNFSKFKLRLPLTLINVYKKGKVIFLFFQDNWTIIIKPGMSGWFFKQSDQPELMKSYNITFEFSNEDLYFSDFRNFGTLTFTNDIQLVINEIDKLAPDILDISTTFNTILERLVYLKPNDKIQEMLIEDALMDQTLILSGIGNIIKSEVLYESKISPMRKLKSLSEKDWHNIFNASKNISNKILKHLNKKGFDLEGYFKLRHIYKKDKDENGYKIHTRTSKYGRKTYWIPEIQK
jgi:formamidopyrimidine-DNA glycosylase